MIYTYINNKLTKLINKISNTESFNIEYSMELLLRELNNRYLEELKFQRELLVNDQIYNIRDNVALIKDYDYKIKDVEKIIEQLNELPHLD
jgi:AAA+ ATPase superfamily predicted ATPase